MLSHSVRKYTLLAATSLASKVAYPLDVVMRTCFFAMVLYIFAQLWGALLGSDSSVLGFTKRQMVWYLMATETIMLSNARIERRIEDDVKSGAVAYTLVRPLHFVWYHCAIYFGETIGHLFFNILIGTLVAAMLVGAPLLPLVSIPAIFLVMVAAFFLQFFIKMILALLAFWVEDTGPFFWVYSKVLFTLGGLFVPIDLYPEWLRNIASVLPFNYVLYGPANLFVSYSVHTFLRVVIAQSIWLAVLMAITFFIYRLGVKKISVNGG